MSAPLSLAAEICTYLQNQPLPSPLNFDGAGTKNCFATFLPDTPDLAVVVMERGGTSSLSSLVGGVGTGARLPEGNTERPNLQIMTRCGATDFLTGNALMEAVFGALNGLGEQYLNGNTNAYFHWIFNLQSPVYLGQMGGRERHLWSVNFRVMWDNPQH